VGLAATFRGQVGLGPKTAARVIRFHRLLRRLQTDAATPLADAAVAHGHYDQAHVRRDVVRFAGTTPARFRRSTPAPAGPAAAAPPSGSR
jgi:methylphosphotriester-DNA--protein-cysteine methyltransferase